MGSFFATLSAAREVHLAAKVLSGGKLNKANQGDDPQMIAPGGTVS
jgi:hypothetical protein